jgi:hypothetical protein
VLGLAVTATRYGDEQVGAGNEARKSARHGRKAIMVIGRCHDVETVLESYARNHGQLLTPRSNGADRCPQGHRIGIHSTSESVGQHETGDRTAVRS